VSPVPDDATKAGLKDYTSPSAANRVLHLNFGVFKYGTSDQTHAAAMVLSLLLLLFIAAILIFAPAGEQADKILSWLESAFLLTVGVAIGKSGSTPTGAA
jgi:hypothetical protein